MRDMVVFGLGQLGQLYGSAALRAGLRVTPITRSADPASLLAGLPHDTPVLVAVGEDALPGVLDRLGPRGAQAILLQNELFPSTWQGRGYTPTVMVPWLLKKPGVALTVPRPTALFGAHAALAATLHEALAIPYEVLPDAQALQQALVDKYAFILTINALGLLRDRTLASWLAEDPQRVRAVAQESAALGQRLCEATVELERATESVIQGMRGLGTMSARGRTARSRVERAVAHAQELGVEVATLRAALAG